MFYIELKNDLPVQISERSPGCDSRWINRGDGKKGRTGWISSRDFVSIEAARSMAAYLTAMQGKIYLAVDEGEGASSRFRVMLAPAIGDEVLMLVGDDRRPGGRIVQITPGWQIVTDQGNKFCRLEETGGWYEINDGFWMIISSTGHDLACLF